VKPFTLYSDSGVLTEDRADDLVAKQKFRGLFPGKMTFLAFHQGDGASQGGRWEHARHRPRNCMKEPLLPLPLRLPHNPPCPRTTGRSCWEQTPTLKIRHQHVPGRWSGSRVDWRAGVISARNANCFSSWWDVNELFGSSVSSCRSVARVCWAGGDAALTSLFQPGLGAVPG